MRKKHYGDFHFLTLSSGVRFGITCLQRNNMSRILDLNSFFRRIYRECEESLGSNHTTTWVARLWDMFTNGYNPEPDKFKSELRVIVKEETAQLGQSHPIVLDSLVRVFAVELMLDRPADDIADLLLKQLRQPQVLEQRLMMSLELEEAVATLYCNKNQYEQGLPIFDYLEQRLKTPRLLGEVRGFEEELETFRTRVKESFRQFRDSAENLLNDEKKRSQIELAESAYRRVALLSRALYGANYHETVKAFFCLAKFLHTSRDSQKCFEGLSIVDNLLDEIDNSKAKTEGSQLWEGHTDGEASQLPIAELGQRVPRGSLHENRKDNDEGAMLDELYLDLLKFKEKFHLQWEKEGENSILEASDREETKNDI
ncbi:hypothetical protein B0O99DRAFT_633449 [Bisporella sp. PMI_857]|nr:hypothetical protein B0O99DRAFT_633449 [Bisporella sp. PMI_857]